MTPPLQLNHLYRVVDRETFAAARDSAWLREAFAPSEVRTTDRPDWSYTGLYFYGTTTYLELFEEGVQGPPGTTGIALGIESPGATAGVVAAWREALGEAASRVVVRPLPPAAEGTATTAPDSAPWFHIAHAVPDRRDRLHLWAMEYHADFLAAWHATASESRGITRAEILERYRRVSDGPADPLLDDITAVSLALLPEEQAFLERHLAAVAAEVRGAGHPRVIAGEDITFSIADATAERRGLQDVVCRLRQTTPVETMAIGRSTIDVAGDRMVWRFR